MLPLKINTDLDPTNAPENSSTLNVNMNADILKGVISNEQGFDIITLTDDNRKIIGTCLLPDNSICLYSQILNNGNYASEIGVLKENIYTVTLRDNLPVNATLGFNTTNLIQAQSKVNFNGDFVVYWVDGNNSDKWLNVTNLQVDVTTDLKITDATQLNLMLGFAPSIGDLPDLSIIESGSLESGVYYVAITYGDKFQNFTRTSLISNPIPVVYSNPPFDNQYIGSKINTFTNKAINVTLDISAINTEYTFVKVNVISKINQVLAAYQFGIFELTNNTFQCVIDTLVNKTEISIDSIVINNADYNSSLTLTQLDDVLYKAHLRSRQTIDLQPYVNNIKVNYVQKEIDLSGTDPGDNFRDPNMSFYSKGFMYDEVYALYVSFIINDNGEYETEAYHVPGREASTVDLGGATINPLETENISTIATAASPNNYCSNQYFNSLNPQQPFNKFYTIDPTNSKIFHATTTNDNPLADTNMGYWENKDETYSTTSKWITLDNTGTAVPGKDFQGQNVRHHKFPEAYNHNLENLTPDLTKSMHPSAVNYNLVNILGIQLSDVTIPDELAGKVAKINIYYAKRDLNNRTILGQSLLQSLSQIHNDDDDNFGTFGTVWNNSGQFVGFEMAQSSGNRVAGIFPVGYDRTIAQAASQWMYIDNQVPLRDPAFWGKGYYKFKAFDLMQQSIDTNSAVYVKNLYRVKSVYKASYIQGTALVDPDVNMITLFLFDPANATNTTSIASNVYSGIDRLVSNAESLANNIRLITNSAYVAQGFPNQRAVVTTTPYPFYGQPFNYGGEQSLWLETDYFLGSWNYSSSFNQAGNDFSYINYLTNANFLDANTNPTYRLYASPYISNLCAYKLNIFQTFDNQVLCLANSIDFADIGITEIYGGDTFTSVNADKGGVDASGYTPQGDPTPLDINARPLGQFRSVHCYITQSTSNPNYRYEGDNSWETFYPYSSIEEMWSIAQTDPEWYGYNVDYSAVNDIKQPVIASNFNNQIQDYFPNRVIRSAKDNPEIQQDNYLDYLAGDYKDFGKIKGKIRNITNQNNKLLIKTDNALYATLGREVISTENAEANVTAGDIFAVKPREMVSSDSYGGGMGRFADVVTQYGYIYPDTTNGIVYNFDGSSVDEISKAGRQIFFRNELKFKFPKLIDSYVFNNFPAYNSVATYIEDYYVTFNGKVWLSLNSGTLGTPGLSDDWQITDYNFTRIDSITDPYSIGVQATFDYKYRRYILVKKDYTFDTTSGITGFVGNIPDMLFANTIVNGVTKAWYNGYIYTLYVVGEDPAPPANAEFLLTRGEYGIYGVKTDFNSIFTLDSFVTSFYPELKAWVSMYDFGGLPEFMSYTIDKTYSFNGNTLFKHNSDTQNALFYNRETPYTSFVEPILNTPQGVKRFSSFSFVTELFRANGTLDYLKTFTNYFVRTSYQISNKISMINTQTSRNAEGYFNANDFRDLTIDNSKPLMTDAVIHQPNTANINPNKHWSKQKKFVDYYLIPRLEYTPELLTGTNLITDSVNYTLDGILEDGTIIKFIYLGDTYVYQLTKVTTSEVLNNTVVEIDRVVSLNNTPVLNSVLTIPTFEYIFKRTLDLFDINTLTHKNTR
jgi:hypothetical protein